MFFILLLRRESMNLIWLEMFMEDYESNMKIDTCMHITLPKKMIKVPPIPFRCCIANITQPRMLGLWTPLSTLTEMMVQRHHNLVVILDTKHIAKYFCRQPTNTNDVLSIYDKFIKQCALHFFHMHNNYVGLTLARISIDPFLREQFGKLVSILIESLIPL